MKSRIAFLATALVIVLSFTAFSQKRGKFDIFTPVYQVFTVTDWVDVTRLALKTTIPGGISGTLYTSQSGNIALTGTVLKQGKNDPAPISLGTFWTKPFAVNAASGDATYPFQYTLTMGDLAAGSSEIDVTFEESADYQRMFPNYRNDLPVNLSLIDGLERELRTYDSAYWTHKLGADGARLVGVGQAQTSKPSAEDLIKKYGGG